MQLHLIVTTQKLQLQLHLRITTQMEYFVFSLTRLPKFVLVNATFKCWEKREIQSVANETPT